MTTTFLDPISASNRAEWSRHRGPVTGVAPIPGSRTVVTSAYDGAVGLTDLETGTMELLGYHSHLVNRVVVNASGTRAASCSSDYSIGIWDLKNRVRERMLLGHSDDVEDFVFADDDTGVSASRDRRLLIWDLRTGAVRRVLEGHLKDVLTVVVDEGRVFSAGDDMTLRVWDLQTGVELRRWGPFDNETDTCALDPRRQRAVLGCDDGRIRIFDTSTGELSHVIDAHTSGIKRVAVSVTGDILSAAYDQKMIVWDARTLRQKVACERRRSTWERSLTWSADGSRILGGTFDGTVLQWESATGRLEFEVGQPEIDPGNPCFNDVSAGEDGEIALVSDDGYVRLGHLTAADDSWVARHEPASGRVLMNAVTIDETSGLVACGAHDHTLHIVERRPHGLGAGTEVALGEGPINSIRIAHHAGHEAEIFAACYSGAIVRISPQGELRGKVLVHKGAVKSLRLHPERPMGVSCGADGLLLSWTFDGELIERYLGHMAIINDVDLDPSGQRLASVSRDFSVKVFEVATGRLLHSIPIGRKSLKSVCFLDSTTVVIGDYWGGLIRVDLESETFERQVVAANGISAVARSGQDVVACSYDGSVYLVRPDLSVARRLCAMHQKLPVVA